MAQHPPTSAAGQPQPEAEEEDYMSMPLPSPSTPLKESSAQRRLRKQREAETARHSPPKPADAALPLHQTLPPSSAAHRMMSRLGFVPGQALGADPLNPAAATEPIAVEMKQDRGGIGLDSERKRKVREETEGSIKRQREEEDGYRERVRREREEKRVEGLWWGAMGVAEGLAEEAATMKSVPVFWRGLVRSRMEREAESRRRHDMLQSLSRGPTYEEDSEGEDDGKLGKEVVDGELDEEDEGLEAYLKLSPAERLDKLVDYMRDTWRYCFWCKHGYDDEAMEGCPGGGEEGHG